MGNFQKSGGSRGGFGGGSRGGKPDFKKKAWGSESRDRGEVTMHKATCSDCGKICEVPFRPTGDKPVFCKDCFGSKKDNGRDGSFAPRKNFDNRFENREPFGAKKSYDSGEARPAKREYKAPSPNGGAFGEDVKRQLQDMNIKIDRLASALERLTSAPAPKEVAIQKTAPKEIKVVEKVKVVAAKPLSAPVRKVAKSVVKKEVVAKKVVKKALAKKAAGKKK